MTYAIVNTRTGLSLATGARRAATFWSRFWGLMGVEQLPPGDGLIIVPCNSVHCFGMRMAIDVVFVSATGEVLHLIPGMAPGTISPLIRRARAVIELPTEMIKTTNTLIGDRLKFNPPLF